ncbi:MAG TPA: IPT/TIG domain-containing protein [Candidatus Dormibacteraeota bacterium]|nr:IPT/TIG domain-containing protein [Candidatus Dormibacteraeota bacterium]
MAATLATQPPASVAAIGSWLSQFNTWRSVSGQSALTENTTWSAGDYDHAVYMVKTGQVTHSENPTSPYYSAAGNTAAQDGNIFVSSTTATSDTQAIDWWMGAPFHAMAMMDSRLTQTGFGSYRDATTSPWQMGATLDVIRGNSFTGGQFPVVFPGNLSSEPLTSYSGNEFPNPQSACPGYTGLPVFIEVGANVSTTAGPVHTIIGNGVSLPNCAIDSTNASLSPYLTPRGGVILMPQSPLQNGVTYTVALTVNGLPYTWSFTVGAFSPACSVGGTGASTVSSINPASGSTSGGTSVTIRGCGFTGATSVHFGATAASSFSVDSGSQITAVSPAEAAGVADVTVTTIGGTSATSVADQFRFVPPAVYNPLTPLRVLDTRSSSSLGPGGSLNLQLGGVTVPANATSVILNVTATDTTAASSLTLYPTGGVLPVASNLNWVAGETVPNLVSVVLGTGGSVTIYNPSGHVDVVVDLEGYFAPSASGTSGEFVSLPPARITDTRTGSGMPNAGMKMSPYSTLTVQVTGMGNVPVTGAAAVVLNVTVTGTTANGGYMIVYPTGQATPLASNLNWMAGQTVPNRVVVPLGTGGKVSFTNAGGYTQLIVDVNGYFTDATASGASYVALAPNRILDTRNGTGGFSTKIGAGQTIAVQASGLAGVPAMGSGTPPQAVILNVTVVNPTAFGWFIIYPDGSAQPLASDLNFNAGQIVPNLVVVKLGPSGKIDLFNANGSSDAVIDVEGYFG